MITISEEIKAKIVIEADTSGADEAAAALEKLQGMAGGEGGIGDALAQQFAAGEEGAKGLTEALGSSEEALKANEEVATDATAALEEHQQAVEEAGSAHEEFAGQVEETANQLQTIPSSMDEVTKSAQTMSEQVSQSGETFASTGKSVADVQAAIDEFNQSDPWQGFADSLSNADKTLSQSQIFSPETIKANMAAFSEAVYSPDVTDPLTHIQTYLDQTGQSWEDFTSTIGEGRMNALYDAVDQFGGTYQVFGGMSGEIEQASKNTSAFADNIQATQAAMDEFNQADPWAAFNAGAQDASKSVEEVGAATEQAGKANEGFFSNYFGGLGDSLFGGAVDETGNVSKGLFGSIGDIAGSFDAFMRPLMMGQMAVQMVTQVGQAIYNSAAIAEGQGAHGIGTFTGAVDSMGYTMQQVGGSFSESFGKQFMATIDAVNQALGDNKGGLTQTGGMLGGALSFASNAIMGALGVGLMATGVGIPLGFTMTQAGMEGIANNVSQLMGWGTEFTGQQATPGMEVQAQVQQGWSQIPTNVIKGTADSLNNTNQILTEASDPQFIDAQNQLSNAQQYMQHVQTQYNAAHPYNQVQEALQSQNDYSAMQDQYNATHGPSYWSDAQKAAQQGNWFGGFGPNQSGGGFFANMWQALAGGPQDAGTSLGMESGAAFRNWIGNLASGAASNTASFFGGLGQDWNNLWSGGQSVSLGGGCFIAGTIVLMADGSKKPIEQLRKGDNVLGYDGKKAIPVTIQACLTFPHKQTYKLTFSDGNTLTLTDSHPLYSPDAGWRSLSPAMTKEETPTLPVSQLEIGDVIATIDGTCTLIAIEKKQIEQVYNITVNGTHTYYANGVLVHNIKAGAGTETVSSGGGMQNLEHTFVAKVNWEEQNLVHQATAAAHWAEQGLIHMATAVAHWAEQGVQHAVTAVANWTEQNVIHPVVAAAEWTEQNVMHAVTAAAQWTEQNVIHPVVAAAQWTEQNLVHMATAVAQWAEKNLEHQFLGVANWVGQNLFHTFVGVASWVSQGANALLSAFAEGTSDFEGGPALVGEGGSPEVVAHNGQYALVDQPTFLNLPAGSSVYPMQNLSMSSPRMFADGTGGSISPIFLGAVGGGAQTANIIVNLDSQTLISLMGASLMSSVNVGLGKRSY